MPTKLHRVAAAGGSGAGQERPKKSVVEKECLLKASNLFDFGRKNSTQT